MLKLLELQPFIRFVMHALVQICMSEDGAARVPQLDG